MPTQEYRNQAGVRLPGVTTVIGGNLGWSKDGLIYWAHKVGREGKSLEEARQGAADIGSIAHDLVEKYIHGDDVGRQRILHEAPEAFRAPAIEAFGAFERWWKQSRGTIVATEMWGVDDEYQTGFCIDALRLEEDGTLALLDWKTSNGVYPDHVIQLAAYTRFIERKLTEWVGQPVRLDGGAHLCRFSKGVGSFTHHWWPRSVLDIGWSAFTWIRALHGVKATITNLCK
jgi:hypothetical protein